MSHDGETHSLGIRLLLLPSLADEIEALPMESDRSRAAGIDFSSSDSELSSAHSPIVTIFNLQLSISKISRKTLRKALNVAIVVAGLTRIYVKYYTDYKYFKHFVKIKLLRTSDLSWLDACT